MAPDWIGRSLRRREDDRLLRGRGQYLADLEVEGQAHVVFVRSPFAHALIHGIDVAEASAAPGVVAVLTAADVPPGPLPPFLWDTPPEKLVAALQPELRPCHPPLLAERALYAGQAVAAVVAESRYAAEDAAELVLVDYEPLEAVPTIHRALAADAPVVHDGWDDNVAVRFVVEKGDADAALRDASVVVRERFEIQRQAPLPLETRGALAVFDAPTGELTLWSATQNSHPLRRAVSRVSGLPIEQVRVIAPDVGGGFGGKGVLYPEDLLVALAAIRLGRPVKWVEDRLEHMQSAIHAREQVHELELGLDEDGLIVALRDRILVDTGAYNPLGLVIPYNTIAHLMGPYRVPAFEATAEGVITTKVPTAPYRGAGRPEAVFAVERALELGARRLGLDPLELRLRNLVRPEEMSFETGILYRDGVPLVLDGGDYPALARRAAELVGWDGVEPAADGRLVGRGLALYVEGTGIGPYEGARVELRADGRVEVRTGACSQGQAHQTVLAQVCADALGVDPELIDVVGGDTQGLEKGWGTVASRSAVVAGNAVAQAAAQVRERLAAGEPAPLVETAYFEPPTVTWSAGAHAAVVAVDEETGEVEVLRYAAVHDCGREINPMVVDGQVRGGIAQGIGGALYEEVHFDDDGQLLSGTLADYLLPTTEEIPPVVLESVETPSPLNPLGLRGVGEGGAIAPPAVIANAVEDALAARGAVVRRTPLTPDAVRALAAGATPGLRLEPEVEIVRH
ncbi:MAG TPA: xanthine dehydrogenase family protein molybdopterin-binding subunit [Gaiellaceae bacterium]|nr:xanthine dehydrogenase family protein molybdopterin-binding subunit [Gaiellaceae bacterium]